MARTQKNKATAFHLGQLKAKLAKYRRELLLGGTKGGGGGPGEGFDVTKAGDARVGLIGKHFQVLRFRAHQHISRLSFCWKIHFVEQTNRNLFCRCFL
jgi:hypothetical protein